MWTNNTTHSCRFEETDNLQQKYTDPKRDVTGWGAPPLGNWAFHEIGRQTFKSTISKVILSRKGAEEDQAEENPPKLDNS